ncbi:antibiotic biosynthesis monooxygenase [bacterium]|nr:MAG: antibiotic biosynthesis monooxygenase [bacterium]
MTTELIRYRIESGQEEAFLQAYQDASAFLARSPECINYEILRGEEEPENFAVIIRWKSTERHLQGFRKSAEFPAFLAAVKPFFAAIQEMKHYETQNTGTGAA